MQRTSKGRIRYLRVIIGTYPVAMPTHILKSNWTLTNAIVKGSSTPEVVEECVTPDCWEKTAKIQKKQAAQSTHACRWQNKRPPYRPTLVDGRIIRGRHINPRLLMACNNKLSFLKNANQQPGPSLVHNWRTKRHTSPRDIEIRLHTDQRSRRRIQHP